MLPQALQDQLHLVTNPESVGSGGRRWGYRVQGSGHNLHLGFWLKALVIGDSFCLGICITSILHLSNPSNPQAESC